MNQLSLTDRSKIINLLVEGNSMRATARLMDCSFNTVKTLLEHVGRGCIQFHNEKVVNVNATRIEADEMWSYIYAKEKNAAKTNNPDAGDAWTWVGMDAKSRLIVSWVLGKRNLECAKELMNDVAARINKRVQLTTDGLHAYLEAVEDTFEGQIDYAQLVKQYGPSTKDGKTDKRMQYIGAKKETIYGMPDAQYVTTSHVERQNLTMRMHQRRLIRKTNGFSKKLQNLNYSLAIYFVWYNFVRIHKTLRVTPAMEAGLAERWMEITDMVKFADEYAWKLKNE